MIIFPSTLKEVALCLFTSLDGNNISAWEQMKKTLIKKYKDYCKAKSTRDEIFIITQEEKESLEDYVEIFQCTYKRSTNFGLD
jgi:hypothetical protein